MKTIGIFLTSILLSTSYAQDAVCDCYNKVKSVDSDSPEFQECVKLHREAEAGIEAKMMELYKSGDRAKMKTLQEQPKAWRACYLPEMVEKSSLIDFQFEETYGKVNLIDMSIDFTDNNEFTGDSYITIEFADYDRMKNWERPEGASTGSITILKKKDTLSSPKAFAPGEYTVKSKENTDDWIFYVNYDIKGHKYSGQFNGSNPSSDSRLKIRSNNGRLLELEFTLVTEKGEVLKGHMQVAYPFTLF